MPRYRCFIRGENYLKREDYSEVFVGFYTNRWVSAINRKQAETKALGLIRTDKYLKNMIKNKAASIIFEGIFRSKRPRFKGSGGGFTFFNMADADENGHHWPAYELENEIGLKWDIENE